MRIVFVFLACLAAACRCAPQESAVVPQVQLSVVRALKEGGCVWERREVPSLHRTVLAQVPGACDGAEVAFSPDRQQGVLEIARLRAGASPDDDDAYEWTLFSATFAGAQVRALGLPPDGWLDDFGIDGDGRIRASTVQSFEDEQTQIEYRGRTYDLPKDPGDSDGTPALVHSFVWDGAAWAHEESQVMRLDDDGDRTDGFEWEERLGPRSLHGEYVDDDAFVTDPALVARLDAAVARDAQKTGHWQKLATDRAVYSFYSHELGETATLVVGDGRAAQAIPEFARVHESVAIHARGHFVLLAGAERAQVVDVEHLRKVFETDALSIMLWPEDEAVAGAR